MDTFQPGELPSADDLNRYLEQMRQKQGFLPGPSMGGQQLYSPGGGTQIPFQPNWRWAQIVGQSGSCHTSGSGFGTSPPYQWMPVQPAACGGTQPAESPDSGTTSYQFAFELNGNPDVPDGVIVQIWEWFFDTAAGGTGRNYVFFYPGNFTGGSGPQNYIDVVTCVQVVPAAAGSVSGSASGSLIIH